MYQSVATIDSPQFLNLQPLDINPLMSECEIKVLYIGENRNQTYISEEVAEEIGKTLRGAPIVGYYKESKEDFSDHGQKVIIDDEGVKFECQTTPYGFVSPNANVWFQTFEESDEKGEKVLRKYLMTTGYLWTGQFPESSLPVNEGRPQSMEFESDSLKGSWSLIDGVEFFIINDAIIQKLCILGTDVEPCFEGASVTSPSVSSRFTLDDKFKNTLYSMMIDLKNALERRQTMEENIKEEVIAKTAETEYQMEETVETVEESSVAADEPAAEEIPTETEFVKKDEDTDSSDNEEEKKEESSEEKKKEDDESAKKYSALKEEYDSLQTAYDELKEKYNTLYEFKKEIDNEKKDALIAEFYMLSEEDKKDVIQNKEQYTLDEIKAKLSIVCFDKKINFSLEKEEIENKKEPEIIYSLEEENSLPDWVKAVKEQEQFN